MEMKNTLTRCWRAFADRLGACLDEAAFRASLATNVLLGRMPVSAPPRREWNREAEPPLLLEACAWTDARALFSVIVWPPLEAAENAAPITHRGRYEQVVAMINRGAGDKRWQLRLEVSELTWSPIRKAWIPYGDGEGLPPCPLEGSGDE